MASEDLTSFQPPAVGSLEDDRWALIQRVVSSPPFARAPQLRGFLLFVASRALAGRPSEINEYEIARAVLGRKATFDPHEDNIVRVQARHLRAKLEQYFEAEGQKESVVVTIPRGTYVPIFGPRLSLPSPAEIQPLAPSRSSWSVSKTAIGLIAFVALILMAGGGLRVLLRPGSAAVNKPLTPGNPLLSRVLSPGDSAKIVISDAGLVMLQEFLHHRVSLESYLNGDYPRALMPQSVNPEIGRLLQRDVIRPYTSYIDIGAANRLLQLGQSYQAKAVIRHPRHLNIRDFETGSFVLLGGPLANPWYRLFENHLNFVFEADLDTGNVVIRNKAPKSGEQQTYAPSSGPAAGDFAIVAVLPNLKGAGNVLLLAGTAMEGTEAAGDMVVRGELPADLLNIVKQARNPADSIEVLLETHVTAGVPRDAKVVAYRVHPADR